MDKQSKHDYDKSRYPKIRNKTILRATEWNKNNPDRRKHISRESARRIRKTVDGKQRANLNARKHTKRRRVMIVKLFGGKCVCCGESHIEFLSIQHKNNDGAEHRRRIGMGGTYNWIRKNTEEAKKTMELMCMNCNSSLGFFHYCPHKTMSKFIIDGDMIE
jgi:hypothetical protein